ncbi:MAG: hypothetical protein ACKVZJ_08295 [Phycisphaerales bacterium]
MFTKHTLAGFALALSAGASTTFAQVVLQPIIQGVTGNATISTFSRDGTRICGSMANTGGRPHGFVWTSTGGLIDAYLTTPMQLETVSGSDDGSVLVGKAGPTASARAYRWLPPAAPEDIGLYPGTVRLFNASITRDGGTIFGTMLGVISTPIILFRWTESGGVEDFRALLGTFGPTAGVLMMNDDGSVVVGRSTPGPFRWTQATGAVALPAVAGATSTSWNLMDPGETTYFGSAVVGGISQLARLKNGVATNLGGPTGPFPDVSPMSMSDDATIVVGQLVRNDTVPSFTGFIWTQSTGFVEALAYLQARGADLNGFTAIHSVNAITSDRRTLIGTGRRNGVEVVMWVAQNAVPPLCPADFNGDGSVNTPDLTAMLGAFGRCPGDAGYQAVVNLSAADPCINTADLVEFLGAFGACPQ